MERCFLPWASSPYDACRNGGPVSRGASPPRSVPRPGFGYPHRGVHRRASRPLAGPERPWACPLEAFPSRRSVSLSGPLPSWRSPSSIASLPWERADAAACRASFPARVRSAAGPKARVGRCLHGVSPSRAFSPSARPHALQSAGAPPTRFGRFDVGPSCAPGAFAAEGSAGPSRGCRLSWASLALRPSRRRSGRPGERAHGFASRPGPLQAARTTPCPLGTDPVGTLAPYPAPPSVGERLSTSASHGDPSVKDRCAARSRANGEPQRLPCERFSTSRDATLPPRYASSQSSVIRSIASSGDRRWARDRDGRGAAPRTALRRAPHRDGHRSARSREATGPGAGLQGPSTCGRSPCPHGRNPR